MAALAVSNSFTAGTSIVASQMNTNFLVGSSRSMRILVIPRRIVFIRSVGQASSVVASGTADVDYLIVAGGGNATVQLVTSKAGWRRRRWWLRPRQFHSRIAVSAGTYHDHCRYRRSYTNVVYWSSIAERVATVSPLGVTVYRRWLRMAMASNNGAAGGSGGGGASYGYTSGGSDPTSGRTASTSRVRRQRQAATGGDSGSAGTYTGVAAGGGGGGGRSRGGRHFS
jgi:hypothetical protein